MTETNTPSRKDDLIAVIGMGCLFPKASGLKAYWRLIVRGQDAIDEVPETHWSPSDYFNPDPKFPDHVYCTRGGYLSPVPFDPTEFGIPPASLEATDTSQLLGLVAARLALEDAGYGGGREFNHDRTSVILGVTGTQELVIPLGARLGHPIWRRALTASGISAEKTAEVIDRIADGYVPWQENSFPGLLGNVVAGRICNRLNLGGTNCVVDAACASSMSAMHMAVMELKTGRSDMVVTGGVDTLNDIFMHMCFSKTPILSPTGDVRPFSRDADGSILGEGIGLLVFKRLADAQLDGDRIYAVIKGIGTASDGRSSSIYAPRPEGQIKALTTAYREAEINPETVELIEAHGTGTRVGDEVEFKALREVFTQMESSSGQQRKNWCAVGTVKSMIGHTKAAAGAAGVIKSILALYHKVLPPTLKAEIPDPRLEIEESPFYLSTSVRPWLSTGSHPRRAGVSAFGFGGSNFHMVLEEYPSSTREPAWDGSVEIFALSGASREEIAHRLEVFQGDIEDLHDEDIAVLAARSRAEFSVGSPHRLLVVIEKTLDRFENIANVFSEALNTLKANVRETIWNVQNIFYGGPVSDSGKLAFVFPGQGSQYVDMGRDLVCRFPEALKVMDMANAVVDRLGFPGDLVYPKPSRSPAEREEQENRLRQTEAAQPAIGAVSLAMARILQRFGVMPDSVCGHSFGELTALCAAGWIDGKTFMDLAFTRGRLMGAAGGGTMTAVKASLNEIEDLIRKRGLDVVLANRNTPDQGVISGSVDAVEQAEGIFRSLGIQIRRLPVSAAFHSDLMESAHAPFAEAVGRTPMHPTDIRVFSNATGGPYPLNPDQARRLLADQILSPVDFVREIKALMDAGVRTFVEVGPKSVLTGLIRSILKGLHVNAVALDASSGRRFGIADLARLLCHLAVMGHSVALEQWETRAPEKRKQRMNIPLVGANYRSPVKKNRHHEAAGSMPAVADRSKATDSAAPIVADIQQALPDEQSPALSEAVRFEPDKTRSKNEKTMNMKKTHQPPVTGNTIGGYLSDAFKVVQEGLKSMQALQMQTAETHKRFLETQAQANRTLQEMMESTQRLAEASLGRTPIEPTQPFTAPLPSPTTASTASVPLQDDTVKRAAVSSSPSRAPATVMKSASVTDAVSPTRPVSPSDGNRQAGIEAAMLAVVGELTGYPVEMISLDMDIEADLGIDSIKRVEILSAFEEKMPHLPQISPEIIGTMKTLGQIVEYLVGSGPETDISSAPTDTEPGNPSASPTAMAADQITSVLLSVVSDLTGYPPEMISPDMDIEADLGIDSIKRVEILSAFEEKMPGLPPIAPETMGTLKTLSQIVDTLSEASGGGASTAEVVETCEAAMPSDTPAAAIDTQQITSVLLSVVSDLTGYPPEMISPDMDIEADLGIDSIKRVEILSAFEEKMPHLPPVSPEIVGTLKTLGQIVAYLENGVESGETVPSVDAIEMETPLSRSEVPSGESDMNEPVRSAVSHDDAGPDTDADRTDPVQVDKKIVVPVLNPLEAADQIQIPDGRCIFITEDAAGLGRALAVALEACGFQTVVASPKELPEWQDVCPAGGLVILADAWADQDGRFLQESFALARRLGPDLLESAGQGGGVFTAVSRLDGAFGFKGGGVATPFQGGLSGLVKTAALEWPGVCCHALDISPEWDDITEIAEAVAREVVQTGPVEVGLDREYRWGLSMEPAEYPQGTLNLNPGDVLVAAGGARGVTAECLCALSRRIPLTFVLLGRSPMPEPEPQWLSSLTTPAEMKRAIMEHQFTDKTPTPAQVEATYRRVINGREIAGVIQRLTAADATVHYESVDVRDAEGVKRVLDAVRSEHGPVKALVYGAGVLEDRLIVDKTPEQFSRVFETKVGGLEVLMAALEKDPLSYLILFSSVAARMGNRGQADYAMANEVLNKIAQKQALLRPSCRVVSFNWGPWAGGMVSPELRREFERNGIDLIPLKAGAASMVAEMAGRPGGPVEIVMGNGLLPVNAKGLPENETERSAGNVPTPEVLSPMSLLFKREVDIERFPVMGATVLDGQPVFPFALMAEWLGHGALHDNPGLYLHGLDDMRLVKRIQVGEGRKLIRLMAGKARRKGLVYEVDVELRNGVQEDHGEVIHSRARAILTESPHQEPPFFSPPLDIRVKSYAKSMDEIYEKILFLGEDLRGIQEIMSCSPKGIIAKIISAPPPDRWMVEPLRSRWIGDPLVLDSAFQMVTVWSHEQKGMFSLPSCGAAYRQYRNGFPENGVTAVFEVTAADDDSVTGNFTFLDVNNEVVAQLIGYTAVMANPNGTS
ncbi:MULTISPECIES: type I polyketide synthase [Desulfococcus]|uniref:type I polyketide synthase n=1 Tax=Desulfococcus TaxID=896 RepID=UPI001F41CE5D|nr:type I polyketide synthase [Desulfococcus multivorans]